MTQFQFDLNLAHKGEETVKNVLASLTNDYTFEDVSCTPAFYHKGDIVATNKETGEQRYIEVKTDGRIAQTHNVLCEEEVYFHREDDARLGNMYSDYDIYCVLSEAERTIYVIDFEKLKKFYKIGRYKEIPHPTQTTYCYLLGLDDIRARKGMIAEVKY